MKLAYFKYLISVFLFGLNGIVASNISLSSYEIVLFRTLIGSATLMVLFFATGNNPSFYKYKKSALFIALSGVSMGASWMFLYEAYAQIGISISTLIYYCGPVFVMVLSPLIFKESLTFSKITGFVVVLCGVFLINGASAKTLKPFGIFCGLMSAVTYCVMVMANKKSKEISGIENSLLQLTVSFITVSVFVGIKSGFSMTINLSELPWILLLGVVNTGLGCYLYFSSIGKLAVQTVAVCGYIELLSAVFFSTLLLKERMSPLQIVGAVLIVGGAILGELYGNRKKCIAIKN